MNELIRVQAGRPAFLFQDDVRVFIAPHDEAYRIRKREFKQRIRELHPDIAGAFKEIAIFIPQHQRHLRGNWQQRANGPRFQPDYVQTQPERVWVRRVRKSTEEFRKVLARYRKFIEEETKWYAQFGLEPPRG